MSDGDIGSALIGLAFLAFLPVFATYTAHARPFACRAALALFLGLLVTGAFLRYGPISGAAITLGILLIPIPAGVVAAVTAKGLKRSIERRYGPTGLNYSMVGTIRDMYRTVWAADH